MGWSPAGSYTSGPTHRLVPSGILHTGSNHAGIGWHALYQPAQALGIAAASALSLGQTIQSIFTDETMTNGDSNIARSWECTNTYLNTEVS